MQIFPLLGKIYPISELANIQAKWKVKCPRIIITWAATQRGPTLSFFVITASHLSNHSSSFQIPISASEFSWSDHRIRMLMHPTKFFATIASARRFPQISLQQLHQPEYLQATLASASQFPQIPSQQLQQPEHLCIHQRENSGNGCNSHTVGHFGRKSRRKVAPPHKCNKFGHKRSNGQGVASRTDGQV